MIKTSKNQALLVTDSNNVKARGKHKRKETKNIDLKPKENHISFDGALGSKKNKKFEKTKCPYCMRGFHIEGQCMKKIIDKMSTLLEHNNISLPQRVKKSNVRQPIEDHEMYHSLKIGLTRSKAYLIDSGASNRMVSSR